MGFFQLYTRNVYAHSHKANPPPDVENGICRHISYIAANLAYACRTATGPQPICCSRGDKRGISPAAFASDLKTHAVGTQGSHPAVRSFEFRTHTSVQKPCAIAAVVGCDMRFANNSKIMRFITYSRFRYPRNAVYSSVRYLQ